MGKLIDIKNKKFGRLTPINYDKTSGKWNCQCACGKMKKIRGGDLRSGDIQSCGCFFKEKIKQIRTKNLVGKKFGRLTVKNKDDSERNYKEYSFKGKTHKLKMTYWICECECGKTVSVRHNHLTSNTVSCGCYAREKHTTHGLSKSKSYHSFLMKDPLRKVKFRVSSLIRYGLKRNKGKKKGSVWDFLPYTAEELKAHLESQWEDWMSWDNYGGSMDDPRKTWHIDHIIAHRNFKYISMEGEDFIKCWSLSNLRPLEKHANREKWYY